MKRKEEVMSEDEDADESPCWQEEREPVQTKESSSRRMAEVSDDEDVDPEEVKASKKIQKTHDKACQLYVCGLPLDTEIKELVEHLAEVGPVKHTFFVKDRDGKPKGAAFVTFRSVEEAEVAIERFHNAKFRDHTLKVSKAVEKGGLKKQDDWAEFKENKSVVITNVPECYRDKVDQFRKWVEAAMPSSGLKHVRVSDEGGLAMTLTFGSTDSVARAVVAFDGAKISNGKSLKCTVKSIRLQQGSSRAGRIMFRNLSWAVKEDVLRQECAAFGKVTEVTIPSAPDGKKKGFGFVQFTSLEEATKAIAALNGKKIKGRAVAVDIAVDKRLYGNLKSMKAPDGAQRTEEVLPVFSESGAVETGAENAGAEDEKTSDLKAKELAKSMKPSKEDVKQSTPAESKKKAEPRESGFDVDDRTLFVRNVAFEATEEDVKQAFSKHGKVLYCKLVINRETGKHKGTGFVKYADGAYAKKCLQEEELNKDKMQAIFKAPAKSSIALEGLGISVKGRKVHILPALKPEESIESAPVEKVEKKKKKESKKTNMHLLHVGYFEDEKMHKQEKQAREDLKKERSYRGSNVNYTLNPYQLTVGNLPPDVTSEHVNDEIRNFLKAEMKKNNKEAKAAFDSCAIVREKEKRVGAKERTSLGFGFVRFRETKTAHAVLHHLNGSNTLPWSHVKRPIVSFTLEDKRKLKQIEVAQEKSKAALEKKQANKRVRWVEKPEEPEAKKQKTDQKKGRGAKQREKRRAAKEKAGLEGVPTPALPKTKKLFQRFAQAPKPEKQPKAKVVREAVPASHVTRKVRKEEPKRKKKKGLSDDFEARALAKMRA